MIITSNEELKTIGEVAPDTLVHGDCLEVMKYIPDNSVDMVLADLPYGTTQCTWDTVIPFEPLWEAYKRVIKPNGAIVLTASQPFTSALVMSNVKWFKYCWVWQKSNTGGAFNAKGAPLKEHEDVIVFSPAGIAHQSNLKMKYFPQGMREIPPKLARNDLRFRANFGGNRPGLKATYIQTQENYPKSILPFRNDKGLHPTQKPTKLFEYLIRTYTNPGELVLDNCMGSGTTPHACINTDRRFIGIEQDDKYFNGAVNRVRAREAELANSLFA